MPSLYNSFIFIGIHLNMFEHMRDVEVGHIADMFELQVEWFVSHWWGTSVATYCSALKRHAYEVKVRKGNC